MNATYHQLIRRASILALSLALGVVLASVVRSALAVPNTGALIRVTSAGDGYLVNMIPAISGDGTVVAFHSDGDFLNEGRPAGAFEVWLYDSAAMTYTRVTSISHADRSTWDVRLSGDGTVVAFASDSDFLDEGIADEQSEIWLYDTTTMTLTRVTEASHSNRLSQSPSLSGDAAIVAFHSDSDFLSEGIAYARWEIWLYDTTTMTYTRATSCPDASRASFDPSLSGDGTVVAFESSCDFLNEGIPIDQWEIWLYDTQTMTYTRVTSASHPNRDSLDPVLNGDGTVVAFRSDSDLLNEGRLDEVWEIWLYDTETMIYTRVTSASDDWRDSQNPSLSWDGTDVVFHSDSDLLGEGRLDNVWEVWLYDTGTMTHTRITAASDPGRDSQFPNLSWDGTVIAFGSDSDLLNEGRPDNVFEIWLWKLLQRHTYLPLVLRQHQ